MQKFMVAKAKLMYLCIYIRMKFFLKLNNVHNTPFQQHCIQHKVDTDMQKLADFILCA